MKSASKTARPKTARPKTECISIYVTCADADEAEAIAQILVAEELIACANILPKVQSIYRWQGKVEQTSETALLAKTRKALGEVVVARIKELHSYDIPCVVIWPILGGYEPYLEWIVQNTGN